MANDLLPTESSTIKPFLKWAGGKRWLVSNYPHLLPTRFNRYIEPFLGSGAVFFHLRPETAILSDSNSALIDTYRALVEDWEEVYEHLKEHQRCHSREHYYQTRRLEPASLTAHAARFIYLNRTCWNGLYRVNQQGLFNVPIGDRSSVIFKDDCFDKISELLHSANLYSEDFEGIIDTATEGDLIFVDPPYTVRHNNNSFIKYNEKLFSWSDQIRLCNALKRAKDRNAIIVGTNAHHESLIELYTGRFQILSVCRGSYISSNIETRKAYQELVILTERERNGK